MYGQVQHLEFEITALLLPKHRTVGKYIIRLISLQLVTKCILYLLTALIKIKEFLKAAKYPRKQRINIITPRIRKIYECFCNNCGFIISCKVIY